MTVMTVKEFKTKTHKYFSLRNGAIGAIDAALAAYHLEPDNRAKLTTLRDAIKAFRDQKDAKFAPKGGDWESSKRESRGGITELASQVDGALRAAVSPGLNTLSLGLAAAAQRQAKSRIARIGLETFSTSVRVTQTQNYNDGVGIRNFAWIVPFQFFESPTELLIKIAVKTAEATPIVGDYKSRWSRQIGSSWNGARLVIPPQAGSSRYPRGKTLQLRFELEWVEASYAGRCYTVNVHQPPPQPAQSDYAKNSAGSWQKAAKSDTVGTKVGTPHMGQWGADDNAAIVHEFGHMIGCPDEYYTLTHMGVPLAADTYDQPPFSTNSIMNNTGPQGRIFPRHYLLIQQRFEKWRTIAAGTTVVQT